MRKNVKAAVGAGVAVVAAAAIGFSGVLTPSADGTAIPNEPTRALQQINAAAKSLADAPAAKYSGTVTQISSSERKKVSVENLTVTAAGDISGVVVSDGRADLLRIGGTDFYKGNESFWRKNQPILPTSITSATDAAGKWAAASPGLLGVDLPTILRPSYLGVKFDQQDSRTGNGELSGTAVGAGTDTPDKRVQLGTDPAGVAEVEVGDSDGGVEGTKRFRAGSLNIGVGDDGAVTGLRGEIMSNASGKVEVDLKIDPLTADETTAFYSDAKAVVPGLSTIPVPGVTATRPTGDMQCTFGGDCVMTYTTTTQMAGVTGGEVTFGITSEVKLNGGPLGNCRGSVKMPINGRGTVSCRVPTGGREGSVNSTSRFTIAAVANFDTNALTSAIGAAESVVASSAGWAPTSPKAANASRRFDRQVTGTPSGYVYKVGDFGFDGRETDGTLLLTFGPGYDAHVLADGAFDGNWPGSQQVLARARDAKSAAGSKPVRLVFAEGRAGEAARKLLAANNITGVEVVVVPLAATA